MAPNFQWIGSQDPEVKSGTAIYFYDDDCQRIQLDLPDFPTAFSLDLFIKAVWHGGKIEGAKSINWAVETALTAVIGEKP